jgi:hypothetical protein
MPRYVDTYSIFVGQRMKAKFKFGWIGSQFLRLLSWLKAISAGDRQKSILEEYS